MKIDSLKKVVALLRGRALADCLNELSLAYTYLHPDSATLYARKAYNNASVDNYATGMLKSLNNSAHIAGLALHNYPLQEKISLSTIQLYKNTGDQSVLTETYMNLALALFNQSYFDSSAKACNEAIRLSQNTGNKKTFGEATAMLGAVCFESGSYEKSFEYLNRSLLVCKGAGDTYNTAIVLAKIGDLYRLAGDDKMALGFYFQSLRYPKGPTLLWYPLVDLGDTYYSLEPYSELYEQGEYLQTIKSLTIRSNYSVLPAIRRAEIHIAAGAYDAALALLTKNLLAIKKSNNKNELMRCLLDMAKAYTGRKAYKSAFFYAESLLQNAAYHHAKQYTRDGYELLAGLYHKMHLNDSAYAFYRKYTGMKDSVALDKFSKKLAMYKAATENEKKQAQIELLSNEKLIGQQKLQISEQQLRGASFQKNMLVAGVLILIVMGLVILRNSKLKQKNEANRHEIVKNELVLQQLEAARTKSELQQQATELEMQALRAQMNPHFIFNSLNAINRFILQNNREKASEYLTKFSRLIRLILQNSQFSLIPLESELEALQIYLELEAVRFEQHFDFVIHIDSGVDAAAVKVPPLVIQPYAENAIWHGLMHKDEKGHLQIVLYEENDMLCCKITDDGIGRPKSAELRSKPASTHKSMGMQITAHRIAMLQNEKHTATQITVTDLVLPDGSAGGTEVLLHIPFCYD